LIAARAGGSFRAARADHADLSIALRARLRLVIVSIIRATRHRQRGGSSK
jgi:hypothetical protein